jgi:hypothetical protein
MLLLLTIVAVFLFIALAAVFILLRKIQTGTSVPAEVLQECSVERYHPMFRLLDESDLESIAAAFPEHSRVLRRRFRAERRSLFRVYLRDLKSDHARIVGAIRNLLVESQLDRPDLAKALYKCQLVFTLAMASIEFKLLLHAMGVGTVDVRSLFAALERLHCQLQDMVFVHAVGYGQGIRETA